MLGRFYRPSILKFSKLNGVGTLVKILYFSEVRMVEEQKNGLRGSLFLNDASHLWVILPPCPIFSHSTRQWRPKMSPQLPSLGLFEIFFSWSKLQHNHLKTSRKRIGWLSNQSICTTCSADVSSWLKIFQPPHFFIFTTLILALLWRKKK
jgi:hypothetical protein